MSTELMVTFKTEAGSENFALSLALHEDWVRQDPKHHGYRVRWTRESLVVRVIEPSQEDLEAWLAQLTHNRDKCRLRSPDKVSTIMIEAGLIMAPRKDRMDFEWNVVEVQDVAYIVTDGS